MTTISCDLCLNTILHKKDVFVLSLKGLSNLQETPLFALDLCAACALKLKPHDPHFLESIGQNDGKGRSASRSHKSPSPTAAPTMAERPKH